MTVDWEGLASAELVVNGRLRGASNAALHCTFEGFDGLLVDCIYKPVDGERPLWDFPTGTLAQREVATFELSSALGWHLVPPTVWRDSGPAGAGMCQLWIEEGSDTSHVDVVPHGQVPSGWRHVLDAHAHDGSAVSLVHADSLDLRRMAVLDTIANNADRKGGHILSDTTGRPRAIDHGLTFSPEPKLRTVLWGWSDEAIDSEILGDVQKFAEHLGEGVDSVERWLDEDERAMLRVRVSTLLETGRFPHASEDWPAIPWPVF